MKYEYVDCDYIWQARERCPWAISIVNDDYHGYHCFESIEEGIEFCFRPVNPDENIGRLTAIADYYAHG